jgi:hypothetical protein
MGKEEVYLLYELALFVRSKETVGSFKFSCVPSYMEEGFNYAGNLGNYYLIFNHYLFQRK